jgi:diguanylate cyclase (GGDEF)-like protein
MINTQVDIQDIEAASLFFDRINIIREYKAGNEIGSLEFRSYAKGKMAWLHCTYQVVKSQETGELFAYFLNYDVDEYNRKLLKERKAVETDFLTGLLNRYSAVPVMRDYLFNNPESSSALIMMDLDDFKFVNDTYGHGCGDEMLKAVAAKLKDKFELYGIVCRLGGDEFLGLITNKSKDFVDEFLAELLAKPVTIEYDGNIVKCSMSAGYAMYPSQGKEYHHLYEMADKAMYSAKHSGKARFCMYSHNDNEEKIIKIELTTDEILETLPAAYAVCEVSANNPILLVNSEFTRFFKCSSVTQLHNFCDGHIINLVAKEDRDGVIDTIYSGFDNYTGQTIKMAVNFRQYDGSESKCMCHIRFVRTREGKRLHVMIT